MRKQKGFFDGPKLAIPLQDALIEFQLKMQKV